LQIPSVWGGEGRSTTNYTSYLNGFAAFSQPQEFPIPLHLTGEYGHFLDNNTINYSNFNLQLIDLVDDKDLVNTTMLEEYFEDIMYPTCIKPFQMKTVQHGPAGCEDERTLIASLIMDAINCESLTRGKVC